MKSLPSRQKKKSTQGRAPFERTRFLTVGMPNGRSLPLALGIQDPLSTGGMGPVAFGLESSGQTQGVQPNCWRVSSIGTDRIRGPLASTPSTPRHCGELRPPRLFATVPAAQLLHRDPRKPDTSARALAFPIERRFGSFRTFSGRGDYYGLPRAITQSICFARAGVE